MHESSIAQRNHHRVFTAKVDGFCSSFISYFRRASPTAQWTSISDLQLKELQRKITTISDLLRRRTSISHLQLKETSDKIGSSRLQSGSDVSLTNSQQTLIEQRDKGVCDAPAPPKPPAAPFCRSRKNGLPKAKRFCRARSSSSNRGSLRGAFLAAVCNPNTSQD